MKSIRSKLTLFVLGLCVLLLGLVWILTVGLFESNYNRMITNELSYRLEGIVKLVETGKPIDELTEELNQYVRDGVCIDIADPKNICVGFSEGIGSNCLVHKSTGAFGLSRNDTNSATAVQLRQMAANNGSVRYTLEEEGTSHEQVVMGAVTQNGYTVLVSTNLERVSQAVEVMRSQLSFVALVLFWVSLAAAWWFARWFARPITALSQAARKVAAGDYSATVTPTSKDEIGILTRDFNEMTAEVAKSSQLQKELIANISHDLRTPLTLIKGYAETVRDLDGDDAGRRNQDLDIIIDETDRLTALVNSVMELSKYSSGALVPKIDRFDLAELAGDVLSRYTDRAQKEGFVLVQEGLEEAEVTADAALIERVLHNLVSNAAAHLGENGKVTLRLSQNGANAVRAEVIDNGCGIKKEELPHLFDRYYRARNNEGKQGNGLGLSIVKAILVAHNAEFGVRSAEGVGSTFWFELPAAPKSGPELPALKEHKDSGK